MPTGSVPEPPLPVTMLDGAMRTVSHVVSETRNRIATSTWCFSPRCVLKQADGISSNSTASHRERWLFDCASELSARYNLDPRCFIPQDFKCEDMATGDYLSGISYEGCYAVNRPLLVSKWMSRLKYHFYWYPIQCNTRNCLPWRTCIYRLLLKMKSSTPVSTVQRGGTTHLWSLDFWPGIWIKLCEFTHKLGWHI